ncbi:MAG: DUF3800 domain-containing protein [Bifidobacteriaceae bacterium]|jgi:hypothetical protein|nr:DUF3800 domain-containing protein [Bifidobacteriaceae bacterium]
MARGQMVFLDDAGDPGFKLGQGSSTHFVIACVVFETPLVAEKTAQAMKEFRRAQGWRDVHEFKFNRLDKRILRELLAAVAPFDYRIWAVRVNKSSLHAGELRSRPESFYNFAIMQALDRIPGLDHADVRLDGSGGREFKQSAVVYFGRGLNARTHKVARFRFVDSRKNTLIQLASRPGPSTGLRWTRPTPPIMCVC